MIICSCERVSDAEIREAIAEGASSVDDVSDICGAGLACKACHGAIADVLVEAGRIPPSDPTVQQNYGG